MRPVFIAASVLLAASGLSADTLDVLFIGNSHTYVNDLPGMVESLAVAGGRSLNAEMSAFGGYSLLEHRNNNETLRKIGQGGWDWVALQEQSQIPVIPYWRDHAMYPASRELDSLIRYVGCRAMFYMTWGWKNGGLHVYGGESSQVFRDYFEMQESVTVAYQRIATELGAPVAPVGWAWYRARRADSLIDLWQADECHATVRGTYLGACVFYARLFSADPTGLSYTAGLSIEDARFLQQIAWQTVAGVAEALPTIAPARITACPNPFRRGVRLLLPGRGPVVHIADASGRLVRSLAGTDAVFWDGCDDAGRPVPNGTYFAASSTAGPRPIVLLR